MVKIKPTVVRFKAEWVEAPYGKDNPMRTYEQDLVYDKKDMHELEKVLLKDPKVFSQSITFTRLKKPILFRGDLPSRKARALAKKRNYDIPHYV